MFTEFFLNYGVNQDLINQQELIRAANSIKELLLTPPYTLDKLPKSHRWLLDKINKQLIHRGCSRDRSIIKICDEILDETNSSALLLYAKSPRKQGVEVVQRSYVLDTYGIEILAGKKHSLCSNGLNSVRISVSGELLSGVKMNRKLHRKSFDGFIGTKKNLVFQKVTTDNGGSTDSVFTEVLETIESCIKYITMNPHSENKFIFLLDGDYWGRKDLTTDEFTRFENLKTFENDKLFVCSSDTLSAIISNL